MIHSRDAKMHVPQEASLDFLSARGTFSTRTHYASDLSFIRKSFSSINLHWLQRTAAAVAKKKHSAAPSTIAILWENLFFF
jgi:hypothetical protein